MQKMDYPVEATVHLNHFQDVSEVRRLLRSHGFQIVELGRGQVRVKGVFWKLVDVQADLELLRRSQPRTASSIQAISPGAVPKYHNNNDRSRPQSRDKYPNFFAASPSSSPRSSPVSQHHRAAVSPAPSRHRSESFVVDADVFTYAKHLRKRDMDTILNGHNVEIQVKESDESTVITLKGRSSKTAANKLQDLLENLTKSLRTQEVPREDMAHEGTALLEKIRKDKNVYGLVLVCEMSDRLHLIGPSGKSYELKQRLLGRKSDPSGRTGRSSSLPPTNRNNTGRENSARARGFSPQRAPAAAAASAAAPPFSPSPPPQAQSGASRRRSFSESHEQKEAQRAAGGGPEKEKKHNASSINILPHLLDVKNITVKLFKIRKKK
ncbi:RNA-binding protein 43 [Parambassis ranga]|uniref:Uncharacterized protein LOC114431589 n=1 Tax=Parambassis ranga TaxID=210632 RepID=A0A6P7HH64_9TELE|nr:uncharacterized protein LOC114431589 [Parambassis ranga]XP_028254946.1 uncharacterized protein LOC114431589 [Parambassis ranga]